MRALPWIIVVGSLMAGCAKGPTSPVTMMSPAPSSSPDPIEIARPGNEGKFWQDALGTRYYAFRVDPHRFPKGLWLSAKSKEGESLSLNVIQPEGPTRITTRGPNGLEIGLVPIGADWTKADKVLVVAKFTTDRSAASSSFETANPLKGAQSSTTFIPGSDIGRKLPDELYGMKGWNKTPKDMQKDEPDRSIVFTLMDENPVKGEGSKVKSEK